MDKFWELRLTVHDSSVDSKSIGFYRTKEAAIQSQIDELEDWPDGDFYILEHKFED